MLRNKLTNAEINESVSIVMADLKRANSLENLMDVTRSILGGVVDFSSLDWNTLDFTQIESDLRQKYADFNANLGETGAAVNISGGKNEGGCRVRRRNRRFSIVERAAGRNFVGIGERGL